MTTFLKRKTVSYDKTLRSLEALAEKGFVRPEETPELETLSERYAIAITADMAALIEYDNDPIAKQFVPSAEELKILPQELQDPIGDYVHSPLKALVHRHANRVLLKPTHACEVYCRFCFRREMVGPEGDTITQSDVRDALDYIEQHREISEVILTGGDPLVLAPRRLNDIMQRLQAMPHIRWIRLHTRVPVVAPKKITAELLAALNGIKPVLMAVHTNHAREITPEAGAALARLANNGVVLLGQSVLLKGVNDTVDALADLFNAMMVNRIKPYYLHHPDLTAGTGHFRLSLERGMALMKQVHARVSGVCMPQYTLDIPGGVHKIPINADYVQKHPDLENTYILQDANGGAHLYTDTFGA